MKRSGNSPRSLTAKFRHEVRLHSLISTVAIAVLVVSALSAGFPPRNCRAQEIEPEALYKRGLTRFLQGKYVAARLDFTEIIRRHPESRRVTSAYVMLAKTYFEQGYYDLAESTVLSFKRSHSDSRYIEWTDYMVAACRFKTGRIEEAVEILARLISATKDEELKSRAVAALRSAILPSADGNMVNSVLKKYGIDLSGMSAESGRKRSPPVLHRGVAPGRAVPRSAIRIGLLAPLSGNNSPEGEELRKGVETALTNYETVNGLPVELLVEDTGSDPIRAVLKARKLVGEGVVAIIGPVYGESTIAAALEANFHGIPFLAPTAPDVGIPLLGKYVFQLNQTPVVQAEKLADFAANTLGFTNAAIIASDDWWGLAMSRTFTREFEKRGGRILRSEFFEPNVNRYNYNDILMRIRASAPESGIEPDSLIVYDYGTAFPDTVIVKPDPKLSPQRLKPVKSIDCIIVSALTDDAVNIVRQIREYHIQTVLLGDTGWSDERLIFELGPSGEGSYLISAVTDTSAVNGSRYFKDDFERRRAYLTSITSRKAYDTCALLIHCLTQGAVTPDALKSALERVRDFKGLSSRYTIDPKRRINTAIDIVQIQNGAFVKVEPAALFDRRESGSGGRD